MRYLIFLFLINFCCLGDELDSPQGPGMLMTDEDSKEEAPIVINAEESRQCPCAKT